MIYTIKYHTNYRANQHKKIVHKMKIMSLGDHKHDLKTGKDATVYVVRDWFFHLLAILLA